jgi:hypothetical protein
MRIADALRGSATQRTYFVGGHRVQQIRRVHGVSFWTCECAEFLRAVPRGEEAPACSHSQRVAAGTRPDRTLNSGRHIQSPTGC